MTPEESKEYLLLMLKHKGSCYDIPAQACRGSCPVLSIEGDCRGNTRAAVYKELLSIYIKLYGKDPDLMELLI